MKLGNHSRLSQTLLFYQNSGSFRLDRGSPLNIAAGNIFVLLGCSRTSPVFDPNEDLCDTGPGLHLCRGLYSCEGVTGIGLEPNGPISSCCVYQPTIALGPDYGLDLPKLQCSSYASIYGFGGDPKKWQFGISLQYNDSYYTESCKTCEASGGICGFSGLHESLLAFVTMVGTLLLIALDEDMLGVVHGNPKFKQR